MSNKKALHPLSNTSLLFPPAAQGSCSSWIANVDIQFWCVFCSCDCKFLACLLIWLLPASWTKGFGCGLCADGNSRNHAFVSPQCILSQQVHGKDCWRVSKNGNNHLLSIIGFESSNPMLGPASPPAWSQPGEKFLAGQEESLNRGT